MMNVSAAHRGTTVQEDNMGIFSEDRLVTARRLGHMLVICRSRSSLCLRSVAERDVELTQCSGAGRRLRVQPRIQPELPTTKVSLRRCTVGDT